MRKVFCLLILLLVIPTIGRAAENRPTNPRMPHIRETLEWRTRNEQAQRRRSLYGSALAKEPSVSITCNRTPTLKKPGKFTVVVNNDDGSDWEFEYGVSDADRDPYGYIYYGQRTQERTFTGFEFFTSGSYELWVILYRKGEDDYTDYAYSTFEVEEASGYPTLEERIAEIAAGCKGADDWHTLVNIHDWLTHNMYYDLNYEYYGAEAILRGKGVCDAYSKAFKMLCDQAGIDGDRVTSQKQNHAWNAVRLDGEWYQVDVTWDDPAGDLRPVSGEETHSYLCLNDDIMFLDHEGSDATFKPGCTSMDANYDIRTGSWERYTVYTADGKKVKEFFLQEIDSGRITAELKTNESGGWQSYWQSNVRTFLYDVEYAVACYALSHGEWTTKAGDHVRVEVTYNRDDSFVGATFLGWDMEETGTVSLPAGTREIEDDSLAGICATTVVIPDGCTSIGARAFADSGVRTLFVGGSLATIKKDAFKGCGKILFMLSEPNAAISEYAETHSCLVMGP